MLADAKRLKLFSRCTMFLQSTNKGHSANMTRCLDHIMSQHVTTCAVALVFHDICVSASTQIALHPAVSLLASTSKYRACSKTFISGSKWFQIRHSDVTKAYSNDISSNSSLTIHHLSFRNQTRHGEIIYYMFNIIESGQSFVGHQSSQQSPTILKTKPGSSWRSHHLERVARPTFWSQLQLAVSSAARTVHVSSHLEDHPT